MFQIDRLTSNDLPAAVRLSTSVGWNHGAGDWQRLLALWPNTCLAGRVNGVVLATATLALYPPAAGWVGMVLVDADHQRKGYGGAMLDEVIRQADLRGIKVLGLDATDQGRPIYLKRGFADQVIIQRWRGQISGKRGQEDLLAPAENLPDPLIRHEYWSSIARLDFAANGWDRSALLRQIMRETPRWARAIGDAGEVRAFGVARPGRQAFHIGPVIAEIIEESTAVCDALLTDLYAAAPEQPVIMDVCETAEMGAYLRSRGFEAKRRLTRMLRLNGGQMPESLAINRAACGFELS